MKLEFLACCQLVAAQILSSLTFIVSKEVNFCILDVKTTQLYLFEMYLAVDPVYAVRIRKRIAI